MSGPLEEELEQLRGWKDSAMRLLGEWDRVHEALGSPGRLGESKAAASLAKARALLAASGTGERPVMCPICNRDDGTHRPGMPCTPLVNLWPQDARTIPQASTGATTGDES